MGIPNESEHVLINTSCTMKVFHGLVGGIRDGNYQSKRAKKFNQCLLANVNMFVVLGECQDTIPHKVWGTMLVI